MAKFYLEKDGPQRDTAKAEAEFRGQLAGMLPYSSFKGKVDVTKERLGVLEAIGPAIYKEFQEKAAKAGVLIAEEFVDSMGRNCRRFHGDARVGLEGFAAGGARCKVAPLTTINGKTYLSDRLPPAARRMAVLNKAGFSE